MRAKARHRSAVKRAQPRSSGRREQQGVILVVGLVILLVVTMLGISGQQSTVLQERLAGNLRQNTMALQAAEAGLQVGLAYLEAQNLPLSATDAGSNHVWTSCTVDDAARMGEDAAAADRCTRFDAVLANWRQDPAALTAGVAYADLVAALNGLSSGPAGGAAAIPGVIAQPRIYIEARGEAVSPDAQANAFGQLITHYYTVTSVGFGATAQARAIVQSTIAKQVHQ